MVFCFLFSEKSLYLEPLKVCRAQQVIVKTSLSVILNEVDDLNQMKMLYFSLRSE
jgi:hypothetical protein